MHKALADMGESNAIVGVAACALTGVFTMITRSGSDKNTVQGFPTLATGNHTLPTQRTRPQTLNTESSKHGPNHRIQENRARVSVSGHCVHMAM